MSRGLRASAITWGCALGTLLVLALSAGSARAQGSTPSPPSEAVEMYEHGRELYQAGRYREAVVELERAYVLDPASPTLVFNIARVYELMPDYDRALRYYGAYLRLLSEDAVSERRRIEATLRRLEGARAQHLAELANAPRRPPTDPVPDTAEPPGRPPPASLPPRAEADYTPAWLLVGASGALFAGSLVFGVLALGKETDLGEFVLGRTGSASERQSIADDADRFAIAADIMLGVGSAALVGALLLFLTADEGEDEVEARAPSTGPSLEVSTRGAHLVLRGAF